MPPRVLLEDVADKIIDLFASDLTELERQLHSVQAKFADFVEYAYRTHSSNETRYQQLFHEKEQLGRQLAGLQETLDNVGISCVDGTIRFTNDWRVVPGLDAGRGLLPEDVAHALEAQSRVLNLAPLPSGEASRKRSLSSSKRVRVPAVLPRWDTPLGDVPPQATPTFILPPVSLLSNAHHCTFYLWFAMRYSMYSLLEKQTHPGARTEDDWDIHLYKKPGYVYHARAFDTRPDRQRCLECGMPPMLPKVTDSLPRRSDGSCIQPSDFKSPALQSILLVDLELAHAKLQFEQTDDILLDIQSWPDAERIARVTARTDIFRDGWNRSLRPVPLEEETRQSWILRFGALLGRWPNFAEVVGPALGPEGTDLAPAALVELELQLNAFYLKTVADTLKLLPARPRERPTVDQVPELYRHLVETVVIVVA